MLVLGPLLALWIVGLPGAAINRLLAKLPLQPFVATADRLSLEPQQGFVLHHVLIYPTNSFAEPIARVTRLVIKPRFFPILTGHIEPREVYVEEGALFAPEWQRTSTNEADARLVLTNIFSIIRFGDRSLAVDYLSANLFSTQLKAHGNVAVHAGERPSSGPRVIANALSALPRAPRALPEFVNILSEITGEAPPRISARFEIAPTNSTVTAELTGGPLTLRGEPVDDVHATFAWQNHRVKLQDFQVMTPDGTALLDVSLNLTNNEAEARATSTLSPMLLQAMLFRRWHESIQKFGVTDGDGLRLALQAGPANKTNLEETLQGEFSFNHLVARGVHLSKGAGRITGAPGEIRVHNVATSFGADGERGSGRGDFIWYSPERRLDGQIELNTDPNDFVPFLGSNITRFVRRFAFTSPLPNFAGTFQKSPGEENLVIDGALSATNFSYRDVPLTWMETSLQFSNHIIALDSWHFAQTNGETEGTLAVDLQARLAAVDLDSTMNPIAVAGLVGPRLHQALSPCRFEGPVHMIARGVVDIGNTEDGTDLSLDAEGKQLGRGRWFADEAKFTVHALGGRYFVTNLEGRAYGGELRGEIMVEPVPAGPEQRYVSHIVVTNADFARLTEEYTRGSETPPTGRVFLDMQLTGLVSEAVGSATRGNGTLTIEDGTLFRLRLLGGLSELLSKLVPGLGFISQTDMTCTFNISDGAIATDDLRLAGDVLSMKAHGDVEFDGRLHVRVEVQLLRRGPLAAILRFITMPVTKLFEFQLTGTLQDPKWRPVNLPKELFLIFD